MEKVTFVQTPATSGMTDNTVLSTITSVAKKSRFILSFLLTHGMELESLLIAVISTVWFKIYVEKDNESL